MCPKGPIGRDEVGEPLDLTDLIRLQDEEAAASNSVPEPARAPVVRATASPRPAAAPDQHGAPSAPQQRVLDAIAWWNSIGIAQPSKTQVAIAARYRPSGSQLRNILGSLRSRDLIDYPAPGLVALQPTGQRLAHAPPPPLTTADLHSRLLFGLLSAPQQRVIDPALKAFPAAVDRTTLAGLSGYEPSGSQLRNLLGGLRSLGLIDYPQPGSVRAADFLFIDRKPKPRLVETKKAAARG
jgi:hypothetical protein